MNRIPGKVAHRKAATKADLLSLLVEREIGYCDADKTAYMRVGGELRKLGGSDIDIPTTISLLMGFEEDAEKYTYNWKSLESIEPIPNNPLKLWSRLAGMGLYAEVASKDSKGRNIADTLDEKTDATNMTPGTYTKVSVNEQGAVTNGGGLEASDIPTHEHSAEDITSGTLDPDRIGEGSVPVEKLEIHKRLYVDGKTIYATETDDSVVIYVGSAVIPLDLNVASAENEYNRAVELCDAGVVPVLQYMVTEGVAYARLSSRGSWGLRFTGCDGFTVTQITISTAYAVSVDSRSIPVS